MKGLKLANPLILSGSNGINVFPTLIDNRADVTASIFTEQDITTTGSVTFNTTDINGTVNVANNKWIIDPIDGTNNFLHGIPHFCISICLKSNNELTSGIIFDPIKNEMFYAEKNSGAFYNNHRIKVSKKKEVNECLFATNNEGTIKTKLSTRITGCAALDLAYVSMGRFDGYFQKNLNIWDIAAGILMVKEAGGLVNEIDI